MFNGISPPKFDWDKPGAFLPYVLNGPIYLFLLDIFLVSLEVNILCENNMLQDFLQIYQFIRDIIMYV
jgi:hypothetical protein